MPKAWPIILERNITGADLKVKDAYHLKIKLRARR